MSDPVLVLHVGFPKCGSSSIQASFSQSPLFKTSDGRKAGYGAISSNGLILLGDALKIKALSSQSHYVASINQELKDITNDQRHEWAKVVKNSGIESLLMSREAWAMGPEMLAKYLAPFWQGKIRIIAFVRPQAEYINSGWWQWGAWTGDQLHEWANRCRGICDFSARIQQFQNFFPAAEIRLHPLSGSVVEQCLSAMDCAKNEVASVRSNSSLPATVLRLFQRHAARLRTVHGSGIDFVIGRALPSKFNTPWVIPSQLSQEIISHYKESNHRLLAFMSSEDRTAVELDARWWNSGAYADRVVEDWRALPPDANEVDALAADLAYALWNSSRSH